MMDLREYLFKTRISQTEFAKIVQTTRRYVNAISNSRYRPGPRLAKDIEAATNGAVTVAELRAICPEKVA
jgi:DNA-binding transcriptional regulator YdaS (Cro superfamily)